MKTRILTFAVAAALAIGLSACNTLGKIEPPSTTIKALADAGCKGTVDIDVGGETGQLGGGFHAGNKFHGECDPANAKPAAPIGAGQVVAPATAPPT